MKNNKIRFISNTPFITILIFSIFYFFTRHKFWRKKTPATELQAFFIVLFFGRVKFINMIFHVMIEPTFKNSFVFLEKRYDARR